MHRFSFNCGKREEHFLTLLSVKVERRIAVATWSRVSCLALPRLWYPSVPGQLVKLNASGDNPLAEGFKMLTVLVQCPQFECSEGLSCLYCPVLISPHWLPVHARPPFNISSYKILHELAPSNSSALITPHISVMTLLSLRCWSSDNS